MVRIFACSMGQCRWRARMTCRRVPREEGALRFDFKLHADTRHISGYLQVSFYHTLLWSLRAVCGYVHAHIIQTYGYGCPRLDSFVSAPNTHHDMHAQHAYMQHPKLAKHVFLLSKTWHFTYTCTHRHNKFPFVRLDGGTSTGKRQKLVDVFNDPTQHQFAFLLSSKV